MKKLFICIVILFTVIASAMDFVTALAFASSGITHSKDDGIHVGIYQLTTGYVDEVNRIINRKDFFKYEDRYSDKRSTTMVVIYLSYYSQQYYIKTGIEADYSTLARIQIGGIDGWKDPATKLYVDKVLQLMKIDFEHPATK